MINKKKTSPALLLAILLLMTTVLAISITACADNTFEPGNPENDFFAREREHILYLGRFFLANGADGYASAKDAPDSKNEIARLENGNHYYVQNSCLYDGEFWGMIPIVEEDLYAIYWVRLDEFLVIYDYISFEEEHINELYPYTGSKEEIKEAGAIVAWSRPGAEKPLYTIEEINTNSFAIEHVYMDTNGREWGFIRYMPNRGNIWVCLSDPLNTELPAFNPNPAPRVWKSDTEHIDIAELSKPPVTLIIVLGAIISAASILLIYIFWKPNTKTEAPR